MTTSFPCPSFGVLATVYESLESARSRVVGAGLNTSFRGVGPPAFKDSVEAWEVKPAPSLVFGKSGSPTEADACPGTKVPAARG